MDLSPFFLPVKNLVPIEVAAALIFTKAGLLIAQRPPGVHLAGLWEFPGGKREPAESYERCLVREIREELGCEVTVGPLLHEEDHDYPEKRVRIRFFKCSLASGEPQALGCATFRWVLSSDLLHYTFPEADQALLEHLLEHPEWWVSE